MAIERELSFEEVKKQVKLQSLCNERKVKLIIVDFDLKNKKIYFTKSTTPWNKATLFINKFALRFRKDFEDAELFDEIIKECLN